MMARRRTGGGLSVGGQVIVLKRSGPDRIADRNGPPADSPTGANGLPSGPPPLTRGTDFPRRGRSVRSIGTGLTKHARERSGGGGGEGGGS